MLDNIPDASSSEAFPDTGHVVRLRRQLDPVAERVECEAHADSLRAIGIEHDKGFPLGIPAELEATLLNMTKASLALVQVASRLFAVRVNLLSARYLRPATA